MKANQNSAVAPGWVGGFAESNPAFAYPDPDLTSLKMFDNMDNIPKIERGQSVNWPEFSWQTIQGDPKSRCYQMFVPDLSRVGYDKTGRIWSIICPQQGACLPGIACMNVEVTVTGQRGWVNEENREIAADMTVEGKIWFTPSSRHDGFVERAWNLFKDLPYPYPIEKADAIRITTHEVGNPDQPIFPVRKGESTGFDIPDFAKHPEAWTKGTLAVEIGPIKEVGHPAVDFFNQKVLDAFNFSSGNMLQKSNVLTWNVWFNPPAPVDTKEWTSHAEKWRDSIKADHGSPGDDAAARPARYFDGTLFHAETLRKSIDLDGLDEQPIDDMDKFFEEVESLL